MVYWVALGTVTTTRESEFLRISAHGFVRSVEEDHPRYLKLLVKSWAIAISSAVEDKSLLKNNFDDLDMGIA